MERRSDKTYEEQGSVAAGGLALIAMPFTFTQDELLNAARFIERAKERGYGLTLEDLQTLHSNRLLLPLYRVSDTSVIGRRIAVVPNGNFNDRYQAQVAAADGRLRDSADEGYSAAWPYRRPATEEVGKWWNGFLYSSWQLLDLHLVTSDLAWIRRGVLDRAVRAGVVRQRRKRTLGLATLALRYLPGILGKLSIPPGMEQGDLERFRFESDVLGLLRAVGFDPAQLKDEAENLLGNAHGRDPLAKWLPLIRHASHSAWSKLSGEPLHCLWLRVGAEVLLRAHEDLAASGQLGPLPDLSGVLSWHPLHDRLSRTNGADPLDQTLSSFGLSPHPRVLLLIEGETELVHARRLLSEFGLDRPEQVRVQPARSARTNPQLLARYAVTPRLGQRLGEGWRLTATPTALVIAMDPENRWATPEKREAERNRIRDAIREEVELQGGQISDSELDFLVNLHVYDQYYELANFSDDELLPAFATLASGPLATDVGSDTWQEDMRRKLQHARQTQANLDTVIGPLRITKKALAEALWPVLLGKIEREVAEDSIETPVLKVMLEVRRLVALLSSGSYILSGSDNAPERADQ